MKKLLYILMLVPVVCFAGAVKTPHLQKNAVLKAKAVESIKSDASFSEDGGNGKDPVQDSIEAIREYRDHKIALTNRIANYEADYIVMTNKIADATTVAKCQTALEKTAKAIESQQKEILALKQMVADLKKLDKAALELK
jgi:hypothetical protein